MKLTLAQLNPIIGDFKGNLEKAKRTLARGHEEVSDLVILPELFIVGYPPRDLLERKWFIDKSEATIGELVEASAGFPGTGILLGAPHRTGRDIGRGLHNSALLIHQGEVLFRQHKSLLPTYDVFEEARYFDVAPGIGVVPFKNEMLGISICEDAWNDPELWPRRYYPFDPQEELARRGATVFINISASPFHIGKEEFRFRMFQNHARKHRVPFVFVNQVGANDELIFDGRSIVVDGKGDPVTIFPSFQEHVQTIDLEEEEGRPGLYSPMGRIESIHDALILGLRDYVGKCGFSKVVIGLSGGIDSAIVCYLATAALGAENVLGVTMPGPYSSTGSVEDSRRLAENLGVEMLEVPITPIYEAYGRTLEEPVQAGQEVDVTYENVQARIRGNILMALSNRFGYLVLSTGNKSEMAVGYCTLYGDMTGGLSVISDVPKTMVYELAGYINRESEVIPREIVTKSPSAELRPDQEDQDTLPPYEVLDPIIEQYVDEGLSSEEILDLGFDRGTVEWVIRAVDRNEYKRRQAAPGLKVMPKAFGVGRRMPIAARYRFA